MFSGRHPRTPDGEYFIDRNGELFPYILDYLRVGSVVALPSDQTLREKLTVEANFYRVAREVSVYASDRLIYSLRSSEACEASS